MASRVRAQGPSARGPDAPGVFRLVDHTADLAIEASGATRDEALGEAALGMTAVLTGRQDVHRLGKPEREVRFVIETPDLDALVVAFLSELLWLHESEDLLWLGGGVRVEETPGGMLRAIATGNGVVHDPARHGRGVEVKAVTYHGLRFAREGPGWTLWVLLDI
jgi:SHS2 domain-containing protein